MVEWFLAMNPDPMESTLPMKKQDCVRAVAGLLLVSALIVACAARKPTFAPITTAPDAVAAPGKFVWYDLLTEDVDSVKRFYGELLGWKFVATESPTYSMIEHDGRLIGGIVDMAAVDPINQSQWVSLLSVPDVDAAARATSDAGGEIHVKPLDIRGRGRLAVVSDPRGALLGYVRALGGDPPDRDPGIGEFMWTELWTDDLEASYEFYRDLIGYNLDDEKIILDDVEYIVFRSGDVPRAGVIVLPIEEVRSHWMPYVRVDDPASLAARVEELGGELLFSPDEKIRHGTVAVVFDPSGAAVALQKWGES